MGTFNFGTSTIMMLLFFGTNAVLFVLFQLIKRNENKIHDEIDKKDSKDKDHGKELSKPFIGTLQCFTNITTEFFLTGLIMSLTYICEKHWIFDHSGKTYSRDLFMFVLIIFFAYAFYTIKPVHDLTLLSREQTEEWKGWMQFIFLLYHYFHAEEVYNSVRVMITCYVWMTGFGNFQFFYVKKDFGWLRVVQMLWRLNFSVLLLMWTHGNTWILYYICPMHTFYFVLVYMTMFVYSSINHTKWAIRLKLFIVGVIIFIVWDWNHGIFDVLFAWLGTKSVVGATNGSVWEYYFRTSLDHWSSFLGMIFAINFPLSEQYFYRAKGWPLYISASALGVLSFWWLFNIYSLEKLQYNLYHSYYAIIPLTSYIFFRNITPAIRSGVSMSLHDLGKTTLETYLLQHHVWLTSNAKTLLTIVPGHPWINFAIATFMFFTLAKELYRLTMSLRGMILPEDHMIALTNMFGLSAIFGICYVVAIPLSLYDANLLEMLLVCLGLGVIAIGLIFLFAKQTSDNMSFQHWSKVVVYGVVVLIVIGTIIEASAGSLVDEYVGITPNVITSWSDTKYIGDTRECISAISTGHWEEIPCEPLPSPQLDRKAYCETDQWIWDGYTSTCPVASISNAKAKSIFKNRNIVFMGDSIIRSTYHQFNKLLNPVYDEMTVTNATFKHSSLKYASGSTSITFVWSPQVKDIISSISAMKSNINDGSIKQPDLLVLGGTLWDALYDHDVKKYKSAVTKLLDVMPSNFTINVWLQPTRVINGRLTSDDKQAYMTEEVISAYRQAFLSIPLVNTKFDAILDGTTVSKSRELSSADGVHYGQEVYSVLAQMAANAYSLHFPQFYSSQIVLKTGPPKASGSMSFPFYGLLVLLVSGIMLLTMDGFLGFGYLSLVVFGRSYDWEAAFDPIHKKLGIGKQETAEKDKVSQLTSESSSLLNDDDEEPSKPPSGIQKFEISHDK